MTPTSGHCWRYCQLFSRRYNDRISTLDLYPSVSLRRELSDTQTPHLPRELLQPLANYFTHWIPGFGCTLVTTLCSNTTSISRDSMPNSGIIARGLSLWPCAQNTSHFVYLTNWPYGKKAILNLVHNCHWHHLYMYIHSPMDVHLDCTLDLTISDRLSPEVLVISDGTYCWESR